MSLSEEYRLAAKEWVALNSAANLLEETKSAVLSRMKSKLGDIPESHKDTQVRASDEWWEYITKMVKAREDADMAKVKVNWIEMRHWERNDSNATRRAEMRL